MEIIRCKRCNRVLKNEESIKFGYGKKCYRIMQLQEAQITSPNNGMILELVDRVRKLELDNNFMKHQLRHKVFVSGSKDAMLDWDIPKEVKEVRDIMKVEFTVIVKELKVIFTENFDYHNVLSPIEVREQPETPPQIIECIHPELLN